MIIAIKFKIGDYELCIEIAWHVEHITPVTVYNVCKEHVLGLYQMQ